MVIRFEPPNASRLFIPDFDREISVAEMEEVFNKLKENKAPGDGIPPGVFKASDNALVEILAFLFNNIVISSSHKCFKVFNL